MSSVSSSETLNLRWFGEAPELALGVRSEPCRDSVPFRLGSWLKLFVGSCAGVPGTEMRAQRETVVTTNRGASLEKGPAFSRGMGRGRNWAVLQGWRGTKLPSSCGAQVAAPPRD